MALPSLSFGADHHAKDRPGMAALRAALRRHALRGPALPPEHLRRRAALALCRSRRPRPRGLAPALAVGGRIGRLSSSDPDADQDREGRRRLVLSTARARPPLDGGGAALLHGALP